MCIQLLFSENRFHRWGRKINLSQCHMGIKIKDFFVTATELVNLCWPSSLFKKHSLKKISRATTQQLLFILMQSLVHDMNCMYSLQVCDAKKGVVPKGLLGRKLHCCEKTCFFFTFKQTRPQHSGPRIEPSQDKVPSLLSTILLLMVVNQHDPFPTSLNF